MRNYDYANIRLNAKTTRKQAVLSFLDGLIAMLVLCLFLFIAGVVFYVIS